MRCDQKEQATCQRLEPQFLESRTTLDRSCRPAARCLVDARHGLQTQLPDYRPIAPLALADLFPFRDRYSQLHGTPSDPREAQEKLWYLGR